MKKDSIMLPNSLVFMHGRLHMYIKIKTLLYGMLILMGCGRPEKLKQAEKAVDIPIKKILWTKFRESRPDYDRFEKELFLIKIANENRSTFEYTDSLGSDYTIRNLAVFAHTKDFILFVGDTCSFVEELQILNQEDTTRILLYKYDLEGVVDEESLIALTEERELLIEYNMPWGIINQYDSHEYDTEYLEKVIQKVVDYPWHQIKRKTM